MRQRVSDLPAAAHSKAVAALDEFDAAAAEYLAFLDTQRALLARGAAAAVADGVGRGDAIALQAAACGRRLAPFREALAGDMFRGPRADAVRSRLRRMDHRAALLGAAAASVAGRCEIERDSTGAALADLQKAANGRSSYGYPQPRRAPLTLDTRG